MEPQSSGIGGGAFLVWYDAASRKVLTWDGRETAPGSVDGNLFVQPDGKPMDFMTAVVGGRSVGTPGAVRLLETVHQHAGRLPWASLFDPAIKLARDGFAVSPRLAKLVADDPVLAAEPTTRDYFFPGGRAVVSGDTLRNPDYAETLSRIATGGADAFYEGGIAEGIVDAVAGHKSNPGRLSKTDLASYSVKARPPVCSPYRGLTLCGMGPPSSGALTVGQILGMAEGFDLRGLGPDDPESWRILGDATRLAFADRGRYMADADFVVMPEGLLDRDYLLARGALIRRPTALPGDAVKAGEPPWKKTELRRDGIETERAGTTHIVVVDAAGNVASMTSTIETAFGAHLMTGGFLLNNQLTDFSFVPSGEAGDPVANRVEPGKRPRSSMAPTIVLKDGKPLYALGFARRQHDHSLCRDDAGGIDRLGHGHAACDRAPPSRQPVRPLRTGGGHGRGRHGARPRGPGLCDGTDGTDVGTAGSDDKGGRSRGRSGSASRRRRRRRLSRLVQEALGSPDHPVAVDNHGRGEPAGQHGALDRTDRLQRLTRLHRRLRGDEAERRNDDAGTEYERPADAGGEPYPAQDRQQRERSETERHVFRKELPQDLAAVEFPDRHQIAEIEECRDAGERCEPGRREHPAIGGEDLAGEDGRRHEEGREPRPHHGGESDLEPRIVGTSADRDATEQRNEDHARMVVTRDPERGHVTKLVEGDDQREDRGKQEPLRIEAEQRPEQQRRNAAIATWVEGRSKMPPGTYSPVSAQRLSLPMERRSANQRNTRSPAPR